MGSKDDGMRVIIRKAGGRVSIWSRNGRPWTTELIAIAAEIRELEHEDVVLDGEAVAHCLDGLPDFHRLLGDGKPTACLYAFDLLEIAGEDLRLVPLERLKERLASVPAAPHSITSSARMRKVGATSTPMAFAAFRLTTSSYLVGACTGSSAGFAPLRIRSTYSVERRKISRESGP